MSTPDPGRIVTKKRPDIRDNGFDPMQAQIQAHVQQHQLHVAVSVFQTFAAILTNKKYDDLSEDERQLYSRSTRFIKNFLDGR